MIGNQSLMDWQAWCILALNAESYCKRGLDAGKKNEKNKERWNSGKREVYLL